MPKFWRGKQLVEDHGSEKSSAIVETEEHLFDLMLKQSDIIEGHLPIPGIHAESHFAKFSSSSGKTLTIHQKFADIDGKNWVFELSSFLGIFYAFTDGWGQFVENKGLAAGDMVSFWRIFSKLEEGDDDNTSSFLVGYKKSDRISYAHQVFVEMPEPSLDFSMLGVSEQSSSCTSPTAAVATSSVEDLLNNVLCEFPGCRKDALGGTRLCRAHGGGMICLFIGCSRAARGGTGFCIAHGDGKRCKFAGCKRSAAYGGTGFCIAHGGGKRCTFAGCTRAARGSSGLCIRHGGGRRCTFMGCTRAAGGESCFCRDHMNMSQKGESQGSQLAECSTMSDLTDVEDGKNSNFSQWSGTMDDHLSLSLSQHPMFPEDASPDFDGMIILEDALRFCGLYPSDHEFDKDTLVQLWMAYGIFVQEPMEKFAALFFENSLTKGYFEFCRTNLSTGKPIYKFKGNTCFLTPKEFIRIEGDSNLDDVSPEASHLSIRCRSLKDSTTFQIFKQLKTLIFLQGHEMRFKQVSRNFFPSLRHLQILDLSKTYLMELPSSVGCMKCLCYLDLSDNPIKRLPETIDCLVKLQTLKLKGCSNLIVLPKGMRKLVSLRHLDFHVRQLQSMPKGMGDLINIQTLSAFLVGVEGGCSIRQLKNMNNLSGSFCISRLENVLEKDDAEEACLFNKSQIKKLELHWSDSHDEDVVGYGEVLSSLQPNTSLEELQISCYSGFELASWICERAFFKLTRITLFEFENCLALPSLGQLPSLKTLNIVGFHKLKVIGHNFYGGLKGCVAFPMLEDLTVENMFSLEEWVGIRSSNFPRLLKLTIKQCPKLHSLCTLSSIRSLENLEISHCEVLASCPDDNLSSRIESFIVENCPLISARILNEGGQDWLKVAHIPQVWIDHQEMSSSQRCSQGVGY